MILFKLNSRSMIHKARRHSAQGPVLLSVPLPLPLVSAVAFAQAFAIALDLLLLTLLLLLLLMLLLGASLLHWQAGSSRMSSSSERADPVVLV